MLSHECEFYVSHILGKKLFKDSLLFVCRSGVVSKTCPTATGSSIPLDILRMGVAWWTFLLVGVWLGHRSLQTMFDSLQDPPRSTETGSFPLIIKVRNLRGYVTADVSSAKGSHLGSSFWIFQHSTTLPRSEERRVGKECRL